MTSETRKLIKENSTKKHKKIILLIEKEIAHYRELTDKDHSFRGEINALNKVLKKDKRHFTHKG